MKPALYLSMFITLLFSLPGCDKEEDNPTSDYPGTDGQSTYFPLHAQNRWNYQETSSNKRYTLDGYKISGDDVMKDRTASFVVSPSGSDANYWRMRFADVDNPDVCEDKILICHDSRIYERDNYLTRFIIGDDMEMGSETEVSLMGDYGPFTYSEFFTDIYIQSVLYHNVRVLSYTMTIPAGNDTYIFTVEQYFGEGIGLICDRNFMKMIYEESGYYDEILRITELTSCDLH